MSRTQPNMSGPEMLAAYKEWFANQSIFKEFPFIVGMSANASVTDQDAAFLLGMHMYASKPVDSTILEFILQAYNSSNRFKLRLENLKRLLQTEGMCGDSIGGNRTVRLL